MLIGGDDISNDVITLGTCLSTFVYIRTRFRFALISGNMTAQVDGEPQGNWRWNLNSGDVLAKLQALFPFPAPPPERPGELARGLQATRQC